MTLGQRIQQLRLSWSLSQEELGEMLSTTRQTVSRWELDQTYPELVKIVQMSKIFSVTTDSLLVEGITTFENYDSSFLCGIYRTQKEEIVETEKFALIYACNSDKTILSTRLYRGIGRKKYLVAICQRDQVKGRTEYAYLTTENEVFSTSEGLETLLGSLYEAVPERKMRRVGVFRVDHSKAALPKVSEKGIKCCLTAWRNGDVYRANSDEMFFYLCTDNGEFVFSIQREGDNIYCGASRNMVFDMGLFCGQQYFRIRNYRDNSKPFCGFFCDFAREISIDPAQIRTDRLDGAIPTDQGILMCIKRYSDDEIVLHGCGGDEYSYRRDTPHVERFVME